MSRYYDASYSFLRNLPVFIADLADTRSPFAEFLRAKGAVIQAQPTAETRYVVTMQDMAYAPPHVAEEVSNALSIAPHASYLHADAVRARLLRRSFLELENQFTGHLPAFPLAGFVGA